MSNTALEYHINYVDLSDRRHPEKSGRMVPLAELLAFVGYIRDEPNAIGMVEDALRQLVKAP